MRRPAIALLLLAAVLRLAVVGLCWDLPLITDELDYSRRAQFLLQQGHLPDAFRPPVYPLFIAAIYAVVGPVPGAVRLAQALLGTATAGLLYRWLRGHVGQRGALLSLALFAVMPTFVGFTHFLFTETLYLAGLTVVLAALTPAHGGPKSALAGAAYGLSALTRSLLTPLLPLAAVGLGLATRSRRTVLAFSVVAVSVLAPWPLHNQLITGTPTVLEITNGYNLWKGNTPVAHPTATEGPRFPGPFVSVPMMPYEGSLGTLKVLCEPITGQLAADQGFAATNACARTLALDYIAADPLAFFMRGPEKLGYMWHPSSQVTRHLWLGNYGSIPPWAGHTLIWLTALFAWGLPVLGIWGAWRMRRRAPVLLSGGLALLTAHQLAVVFVTFGHNRFRLPVLLFAVIAAAWIPDRSADEASS
jgi:4-amino-4-deoxy-L-arabinose transferase-like glycosyltransferase